MFMKRLMVVMLALAILFSSVSIAEEQTAEQKANEIFNSLANIYDSLLFYLEQRQTTWTMLLTAKSSDVSPQWFMNNMYIYDDIDRASAIISFAMEYGMTVDEIRNADSMYQKLFEPLYKTYGENDDGLAKACMAFTMMVFYDETLQSKLNGQKEAIKSLMTEEPEYAYLTNLQDFYKKTSQLMNYVQDSSDNYSLTIQRISDFQQTKRELKSDFDFVFDWPDYIYVTRGMSETFKSVFDRYAAEQAWKQQEAEKAKKEEEEKPTRYQEALELEKAGSYAEAIEIYKKLGKYEDAAVRIEACQAHLDAIEQLGVDIVKGTKVYSEKFGEGEVYSISQIGDSYSAVVAFTSGKYISYKLPDDFTNGLISVVDE